jgi:hypothetical protein
MSAFAKLAAAAPDAVNVVDFAQVLVNNRRAAVDLPVDRIRELAAAILILDQQLDDANGRIASMMLAEQPEPAASPQPAKPEIVRVPIVTGGDPQLTKVLDALVEARWHLEQERHSSGENTARQKFEKAAIAVSNHVSPKRRT